MTDLALRKISNGVILEMSHLVTSCLLLRVEVIVVDDRTALLLAESNPGCGPAAFLEKKLSTMYLQWATEE